MSDGNDGKDLLLRRVDQENPLLASGKINPPSLEEDDARRASRQRLQLLKTRLSSRSLSKDQIPADHEYEEKGSRARRSSSGESDAKGERGGVEMLLMNNNVPSSSAGSSGSKKASRQQQDEAEESMHGSKRPNRPTDSRANKKPPLFTQSHQQRHTLGFRGRIIQISSFILVIESFLAVQTICVFDKICYAQNHGNPAIPTAAANAVIPLALITAMILAPLGFYAIDPKASRCNVFLIFILTTAAAIFYLVVFSILVHKSKIANLQTIFNADWNTYSAGVHAYYESPHALAEEASAYYTHLGSFGLMGFIPAILIALGTFAQIFEPICFGHTWM